MSKRQLEVIELVVRGLPNKEVAARLGIGRSAVEGTLTRIYEKLGIDNRGALIAFALSERTFGVAVTQRDTPRSATGALRAPRSLEDETLAYAAAPFMVAITHGAEHRFIFVNAVAAEVAGRGAASMIGHTVGELFPELDPRLAKLLDTCYRSGVPQSIGAPIMARMTREDGSVHERLVNMVFQPVRDATGVVVGLLHIGTEVDARAR